MLVSQLIKLNQPKIISYQIYLILCWSWAWSSSAPACSNCNPWFSNDRAVKKLTFKERKLIQYLNYPLNFILISHWFNYFAVSCCTRASFKCSREYYGKLFQPRKLTLLQGTRAGQAVHDHSHQLSRLLLVWSFDWGDDNWGVYLQYREIRRCQRISSNFKFISYNSLMIFSTFYC